MVSALDSGSNGPGSSQWKGTLRCVLGQDTYSHSTSLHPGMLMVTRECNTGDNRAMV